MFVGWFGNCLEKINGLISARWAAVHAQLRCYGRLGRQPPLLKHFESVHRSISSAEKFRNRRTSINHRSALDFSEEITSYIHDEVKLGTLLGPFDGNPFSSQAIVLPLSTREKKDSTDRRVIMDFFPSGKSANDKIQNGTYLGMEYKLTYPSVDALVEPVKKMGKDVLWWNIFEKSI